MAWPVSDSEIVFRILKPIVDDYDYQVTYRDMRVPDVKTTFNAWATYGPIWTDFFAHLIPERNYKISAFMLCSKNMSIHSANPASATQSTFPKCASQCFYIFVEMFVTQIGRLACLGGISRLSSTSKIGNHLLATNS